MISFSKPIHEEIKSLEELDRAVSKDDVKIFGFFDLPKHKKLFESFKMACIFSVFD